MKKILGKIPAMIAMLIAVFSFLSYVYSFIDTESDYWTLSAILAAFSMIFFFIDAIISFVKAIKKDDSQFNYILALILICAIPMILIFGGAGGILSYTVIWNVYYLLMFVLEVVSIVRCAKK